MASEHLSGILWHCFFFCFVFFQQSLRSVQLPPNHRMRRQRHSHPEEPAPVSDAEFAWCQTLPFGYHRPVRTNPPKQQQHPYRPEAGKTGLSFHKRALVPSRWFSTTPNPKPKWLYYHFKTEGSSSFWSGWSWRQFTAFQKSYITVEWNNWGSGLEAQW